MKAKKPKKPVVKKPPKLKNGTTTMFVEQPAYIKAAVLQVNTKLEWSGYGPVMKNGDGYKLLDFYYLSSDDSGGETNLSPEATAQAWMEVCKAGIDPEKVQLAWVHCHPWSGGGFWSATDEQAIKELTERIGKGTKQISVLFHGPNVTARLDEHGKIGERLVVNIDRGQYAAEIDKAAEIEKVYFTELAKKQAAELEMRKALEAKAKEDGQPALPTFPGTLPWFLEDDYESLFIDDDCGLLHEERDEKGKVTWGFTCEVCEMEVSQTSKPRVCQACGARMCVICTDKIYPNACKECALDVDNVAQMADRMGPIGFCYLCEDPIEIGDLYCGTCRGLFQNVKGKVR